MSRVWRLAQWAGGITAATAVAATVLPGHRSVAVSVGVMALLGLFLVEIGRATSRLASPRDPSWERVRNVAAPATQRPDDLARIERRFGWGRYSMGDFNYRVRPILRRLVARRLENRQRIDLDERPNDARGFVSNEVWDLVVDKQPPEREVVLTTSDIERLVSQIEEI